MDKILSLINDKAKMVTGREIKLTMESSFSRIRSECNVEMSSIEIITLLSQIEEEYNVEFDELPGNVHDLVIQLHEFGGAR